MRKSGSIAINADMAHYKTDLMASLLTGGGVYLSGILDQPLIDSGVGGLVSLYLLHGAWEVGRSSFDVLMDRELPAADRQRVVDIVRAHPAVRNFHELRTRSSGLTKFIQLHIDVDRDLSLVTGHRIGAEVQARIQEAFPDAEIILHVDPMGVAP